MRQRSSARVRPGRRRLSGCRPTSCTAWRSLAKRGGQWRGGQFKRGAVVAVVALVATAGSPSIPLHTWFNFLDTFILRYVSPPYVRLELVCSNVGERPTLAVGYCLLSGPIHKNPIPQIACLSEGEACLFHVPGGCLRSIFERVRCTASMLLPPDPRA